MNDPDDNQEVPNGNQEVPDDNQEVPNDNQEVPNDSQSVPNDNQGVADENKQRGDGNEEVTDDSTVDNEAPSIKAKSTKFESTCKCKCKCCSSCKCKITYDPSKEEVWIPNGAKIGHRLNINLFSDTQYIGMNLFNIINRVADFN